MENHRFGTDLQVRAAHRHRKLWGIPSLPVVFKYTDKKWYSAFKRCCTTLSFKMRGLQSTEKQEKRKFEHPRVFGDEDLVTLASSNVSKEKCQLLVTSSPKLNHERRKSDQSTSNYSENSAS